MWETPVLEPSKCHGQDGHPRAELPVLCWQLHAQGSGIQAVPSSLVSRESFEISPSAGEQQQQQQHPKATVPCPRHQDRVEEAPSSPAQPISTLTPGALTHGAPAMRQRTSDQGCFL